MDKKIKMMIVEDDVFYGELLKYIFNVVNVEIINIKSGEDCIDNMNWYPNIIILDHHLGTGIDGLETLKKIKEKNKSCEIIVLTNNTNYDVLVDYTNLGINKFINKTNRPIILLLEYIYDLLDKNKLK